MEWVILLEKLISKQKLFLIQESSDQIERPVSPAEKAVSASVSRARTIAEKLGFVPYNEEELDTPTYLRAGHKQPNISERTELN